MSTRAWTSDKGQDVTVDNVFMCLLHPTGDKMSTSDAIGLTVRVGRTMPKFCLLTRENYGCLENWQWIPIWACLLEER